MPWQRQLELGRFQCGSQLRVQTSLLGVGGGQELHGTGHCLPPWSQVGRDAQPSAGAQLISFLLSIWDQIPAQEMTTPTLRV